MQGASRRGGVGWGSGANGALLSWQIIVKGGEWGRGIVFFFGGGGPRAKGVVHRARTAGRGRGRKRGCGRAGMQQWHGSGGSKPRGGNCTRGGGSAARRGQHRTGPAAGVDWHLPSTRAPAAALPSRLARVLQCTHSLAQQARLSAAPPPGNNHTQQRVCQAAAREQQAQPTSGRACGGGGSCSAAALTSARAAAA